MKSFGFELLIEQATEAAASQASAIAAGFEHNHRASGDSPIERLVYCALYLRLKFEQQIAIRELVSCSPESMQKQKNEPGFSEKLFIQKQVTLDGIGRVDFVFTIYGDWIMQPEEGKSPGWRQLIVECDGHEFHERTKEQAAKDRSRDRAAAMLGYEVFRFTGSELWRDPWECAGQIIDWANRGL